MILRKKPAPPEDLERSTSDEELLEMIQKHSFRYFWEGAHPDCGLALERNSDAYKEVVTTGGSGFGLMTMIVAVKRGWVSPADFILRLEKILSFLLTCEKYHGAFSHWYQGYTGKTLRFGKKDDGADLVETSFLIMGLLSVRQFLETFNEKACQPLIEKIQMLWLQVEWNWFQQGENVLYWHWSPHHRKQIGLKIEGYHEALITYLLAAASPTYGIDRQVYDEGWARNGQMKNGQSFYERVLPLGPDYGGPLYAAQYSFLGLDPRKLRDRYADYWQQNVNHCYSNYAHCVNNPKGFKGYGPNCWGLSACDSGKRYQPHHPQKDNGTICPPATMAALPYLPAETLAAIRHFYFDRKAKLWGDYGFYDAFNKTRSWYARSYLAINQGPVIVMIENYRTGLLWRLFMSCAEVQEGLKKLGFETVFIEGSESNIVKD